jgi:membrane protein
MFIYFRAPVPWSELVRRTIADAIDDGVTGLAAQLAFYFFLALFPALLVLVSLLAYLPIEPAVGVLLTRLEDVLPSDGVSLVRNEVDRVLQGDRGGLITLGVAGALWSSSSAMVAVISTLNRAFDIEDWRPWWKTRLLAIGLTLALSIFVLAAFTLVVGGEQVAAAVADLAGLGGAFEAAWRLLQWPIAFALVVFAIDLIYHFAPNADTRWAWITPGSLAATVLWAIVSIGFKFYVRSVSDFSLVYGAIGGVIVTLLWLYLSALAILAGAELNAEIDRALPTRDGRPQHPGHRKKIGPATEAA